MLVFLFYWESINKTRLDKCTVVTEAQKLCTWTLCALENRGAIHVVRSTRGIQARRFKKITSRGIYAHFRGIHVRLYGRSLKYTGHTGHKEFLYSFLGCAWSLGALSCLPREKFLLQINTQEAASSQGPFGRFALYLTLEIADPTMVMAAVPL